MKIFYIIIKFFCNNLGILAVIIYFCFVLIDLSNDYKNIYSLNTNACLRVCVVVFKMLLKMIFSMKRGYVDFWVT